MLRKCNLGAYELSEGKCTRLFCLQHKTSACTVVEYVAVRKRIFGLVAVVGLMLTAITGRAIRVDSASTVAIKTEDSEAPSAAA